MSRSWAPVVLTVLVLISPATAAARGVSFSDTVREHVSAETRPQPDAGPWQRIIAEQEIGQSCESREPGRLVIRHPPIVDPAPSGAGPTRKVCDPLVIKEALLEQKPIELENVVIGGTIDLRDATRSMLQRELRMRGQRQVLLQQWLDERRRDQRVPDLLPGETAFRAVNVPISIRNSRIGAIKASAEDPILFTDAIDLRGTSVMGPVSAVGAIFMDVVILDGTDLQGVTFSGSHFDAGIDLSRASVSGEARFDGTTFGARALSRPAGRARLGETRALFIGTTFAKPVTFRDAVFDTRADFRKATFVGETELVATRFQRLADFGGVTFKAPVEAANAIFETDARFPSAVFEKPATFRAAEFRGYADFALATFTDQASSFRNAQFGPALFFPRASADVKRAVRQFWNTAGYDFRETKFANKARALARADFQVHWVFTAVTFAACGLGLLFALAMRRPRMVHWARTAEPDAVARVWEAESPGAWRRPASPRERLADAACLIAAYGVLAVGLATHYQAMTGYVLDRTVIWLYPLAGLAVWAVIVFCTLNPFRLRAQAPRSADDRAVAQAPMLDYFDPTYHVVRRCDRFVHTFVTRVSTGVLGLAGPRGAGRSALARATLDSLTRRRAQQAEPAPVLAVTMPSPPAGDLMAFFTVLFRRVGQQVQRELRCRLLRFDKDEHTDEQERLAEELIQAPPGIALLPLAVVVWSVLFFLASPWWSPSPTGGPGEWTPWILIGSLVSCTVIYYAYVLRRLKLRRKLHEVQSGQLYVHTERALERLSYEESTSEERQASLSLPRGLSFSGKRARALKERATTLGTMVDDFGRYVARLRRIFSRGVVVHIDDADRAEDVKDVRDLILRLKGTLVGGVLYLVPLPHVVLDSATDGAATAVAGMLDDVIVVPPMTFEEAFQMVARRRFFTTDAAAEPNRLETRDGLGTTMCLLAGGIPKEILRLLRRVSTDGHDWTARNLVEMSAREARDGGRMAVQRSALTAAQKERVLEAMDRGDDGTSVERVALSTEPPVNDAPLLDLLRRLDRRRATIHTLRSRLDDLKVLEGELVAALAAGRPIDQVPSWVMDLHRTCVTVQTGMTPGGPTA